MAVPHRAGARVHSGDADVGGDSARRAAADAVGPHRHVGGNLPVGFLFMLAISSLGVYGIVLAGWSSNNKYALLGGLRSSAQMISYEIAMGSVTIPVLLLAGNVSLTAIMQQQAQHGLERAVAYDRAGSRS